ncbi:hypothetical protein DL96DRAFT_1711520 [Flagelloscypha sp. PMI_526]|nr:hypothetical protein DL96DRAFT_1711520 [Flagelloscypha sp. PMI_526]
MQMFNSYTLLPEFKCLHGIHATELEMTLSAKVITDRSNVVITCTGILCGMIYQENYVPGRLNNTSKVLVTMSLLIVTFNRLQYEGQCVTELRTRVQKTGPLVPTLRYILSEAFLAILLILEGFKAGGVAGGTMVVLLCVVLLGLGSVFSIKNAVQKAAEPEVIATHGSNV